MISNEHEKSAEEEKFEIDIRNYTAKCKHCLETFPGHTDYENHKCTAEFKMNTFDNDNFVKEMEERRKEQPHPGLMEIPVAKNFDIVYARLARLEAFADKYSSNLKDSIDKLNLELVKNCYDPFQPIPSNLKPHKCPVCQGSGGVKHPLTGLLVPAECHSCEGKGIVWG